MKKLNIKSMTGGSTKHQLYYNHLISQQCTYDIHLNVIVDAIKNYLYKLRKPVLNTFPQMTLEQHVHSKQKNRTTLAVV